MRAASRCARSWWTVRGRPGCWMWCAARIMDGLNVSFTLDGAPLPSHPGQALLEPGGVRVSSGLLLPARPDNVTGRSQCRQPPAGSHDSRRIRPAKLPRWDHVLHRRTWHWSLRLTRRTPRSAGQNRERHGSRLPHRSAVHVLCLVTAGSGGWMPRAPPSPGGIRQAVPQW
jgi:hypothetical protein